MFGVPIPGLFAQDSSDAVSEPWQRMQESAPVEIMDASMTFDGKETVGQAVHYRQSSSSFNNILVVPLGVNLADYQSLSFMIKMDPATSRPEDFRIDFFTENSWYLKNGPRTAGTNFFEHAVEMSPGEYLFRWNFADIFADFEMAEARFLALIYPTPKIPEEEVSTFMLSPVTFHK